jgi:hypothetical protein
MSPKKQSFGMEKTLQPSFPPSPLKKTPFLSLFKNERKKPNPCPSHPHPQLTFKTTPPKRGTKSFKTPPLPFNLHL